MQGTTIYNGIPNNQIAKPPATNNNQVIVQTQPAPVVTVEQGRRHYDRFYAKTVAGLGIVQIVMGGLAMLMNIIIYLDLYRTHLAVFSHAMWGGVFFVVTGCLATGAGFSKNKCIIISAMVMCIIVALAVAPNMLITAAVDLGLLVEDLNYEDEGYYSFNFHHLHYHKPPNKTGIAIESVILSLAVIEFFVSIITAAFCGHGLACCGIPGTVWSNRSTQYTSDQPPPQHVVHYSANAQPGYPSQQASQPAIHQQYHPIHQIPPKPDYVQQGPAYSTDYTQQRPAYSTDYTQQRPAYSTQSSTHANQNQTFSRYNRS